MNQPILCCLKIKPATLFIGIIDLMMHIMVIATLFAAYSHPNLFDHYYANSISLVVSPSSSLYSMSTSNKNNDLSQSPIFSSINEGVDQNQVSLIQNSNTVNAPFLWQLQQQQKPRQQLDSFTVDKVGNTNILPNRLTATKEKSLALLVTAFSLFLTVMLIYGILKNKGLTYCTYNVGTGNQVFNNKSESGFRNLLMPYFSIKVFQLVMACLTTLGFYNCLPNVRYWIETHRYFPLKKELLLLENQTLELFVFSILISSVLVKLYIVIIVWYCYRYMVTLESFRNMTSTSVGFVSGALSTEDLNNNGFKIDDESLATAQSPPKYDDIMKQIKTNTATMNETQNVSRTSTILNQNQASTSVLSSNRNGEEETSAVIPLVCNQPPSYSSAIKNY